MVGKVPEINILGQVSFVLLKAVVDPLFHEFEVVAVLHKGSIKLLILEVDVL